jgi:hypothetical protein
MYSNDSKKAPDTRRPAIYERNVLLYDELINCAGNNVDGVFLGLFYRAFEGLTVSRARPTRRRARIILAPAVVAIRTRKP